MRAPTLAALSVYEIVFVERQRDGWSEPQCLKLIARYPELR